MNFNHGRGSPHLLGNFDSTLVIVSNLFHVNTHRLSLFSSWPKGPSNIIHNSSSKILSFFNPRSFWLGPWPQTTLVV
jgi:hypothetical protein